ncbi:sulfotransferase family protein [Nocardioides ferulae]|uniref:sulfotransferase family protein n=1 Tax=Nocardioides ferulae TaxID=2340821 RepID=UPI000EB449FF|nr:sulfotransferase family protein [Nocardioides ferulae]
MPAADPVSSARQLVLVAGAGRSGTSTFAGILQRLGLHVPQPEVQTDDTNPKGFGEPRWVVDFHDDLLGHANVQVSDARPAAWERTAVFAERPGATGRLARWLEAELEANPTLVIKDPRLSWFLPLWTGVAARLGATASFVTMLRPPAEVVGSKRAHYNTGLQDAQGAAAWVNMLLGTERATRGSLRAFVRYHDLLDDWRPVVEGVHQTLGLPALSADDPRLAEIDGFVDPGLRRVRLDWADLDLPDRLATLTREAWEELDRLADPTARQASGTELEARLDAVRERYAAYYLEAETVSRSTAIAARHAGQPPRSGPAAAPDSREVTPAPGPGVRARRLALASVRRLPAPLRRLVPAGLRARMAARLGRAG